MDMPKDKKDGKGSGNGAPTGEETEKHKLKRKDYEEKLRELHVELVELQEWVRREGKKVCIIFEGRDGAGKGGTASHSSQQLQKLGTWRLYHRKPRLRPRLQTTRIAHHHSRVVSGVEKRPACG